LQDKKLVWESLGTESFLGLKTSWLLIIRAIKIRMTFRQIQENREKEGAKFNPNPVSKDFSSSTKRIFSEKFILPQGWIDTHPNSANGDLSRIKIKKR